MTYGARTRTAGIALLSLAVLAVPAPAAADSYGENDLQRDADGIRDTGTTGVLAEVVSPKGRMRARSGVADLGSRQPVPWDAYYRIGSNTKTFVSTVTLQLAEERKLKLTDTVHRWLPGVVKGKGNDGRKITIRHLLRQNSGLYDYTAELPLDKDHTPETYRRERFRSYEPRQLVGMAMRHKPNWIPRPGERRWAYSNTNYILAGMIIEKATGNPWEHEVHERIIQPLGLRHTFSPGTGAYVPQPRATFYQQFTPGGRLVDVSVISDGYADGGLLSTTNDVGTFFRALLAGRLLRPAQLAEMKRTVPAKPWQMVWRDAAYGLGLAERSLPCGGKIWYHGGGMAGVQSVNGFAPDGQRSVELSLTTSPAEQQQKLAQMKAATKLIDRAICGTR